MTRAEKRAMERAKEKYVKLLIDGGYNRFTDLTHEIAERGIRHTGEMPEKVYRNNLFVVQVFDAPNAWGACKKIAIRWNDARPDHDWQIFQRIKNDIFGPDRVALEVYPSERYKFDVANMYWLFLLPEGFDCPIELKSNGR